MRGPYDGVMETRTSWLLFDGNCGFCTSAARWIERSWPDSAEIVPWQAFGEEGLDAIGLTVRDVSQAAWWVDGRGRASRGHRAVGKALLAGGGWRAVVGVVILTPPICVIAAGAYWMVARYRYLLPGTTPACR